MSPTESMIREAVTKIREKERELTAIVMTQNASRRSEFMAEERSKLEAGIEELTVALVRVAE